jgi:hypothetical protein
VGRNPFSGVGEKKDLGDFFAPAKDAADGLGKRFGFVINKSAARECLGEKTWFNKPPFR